MRKRQIIIGIAIATVFILAISPSFAVEIAPGHILNPLGLQNNFTCTYNSENDEYLIAGTGFNSTSGTQPQAFVVHLSPVDPYPVSNVTYLSPSSLVQEHDIVYNPDRNEYIVVWRNDNRVAHATYLDGDGNEIGTEFLFSGDARGLRVDYSTVSNKYMVVFLSGSDVYYRIIDGDSTSGTPLPEPRRLVQSAAFGPAIAYGSTPDKFFITYHQEAGGNNSDNIYGRFVPGDGNPANMSSRLNIDTENGLQQASHVAYASSANRWMVVFSTWENGNRDAKATLVAANGSIVTRSWIATSPLWDVAQAITYNSATDRFFVVWREEPYGYGRPVDPHTGQREPIIQFSTEDIFFEDACSRNLPSGPQYLGVWREQTNDGIHAGIVEEEPVTVTLPPLPPAESGHVNIVGDTWNSVTTSGSNTDPVIIAGVPTYNGEEPGVARLRNVSQGSFEIAFSEWGYLDGVHATEDIPYLELERGRYVEADGSTWEIGTFSLDDTGTWSTKTFDSPFSSAPALFLTAQTSDGVDPVTVRARNVTQNGFEAALFEEESFMGSGHVPEVVGYLAIYNPQQSGFITEGGQQIPYLLQTRPVDERFVPVLSHSVMLEEETSLDDEIGHLDETLSIMVFGDKLFAQDVTSLGPDTVAVRQLRAEYQAQMEWGIVDGVDHGWLKVPLAKAYTNPVVVAKPVSGNGEQPGEIRVRNVSADSFELRYEEWLYLDGNHITEQVFYLVVEEGTQSVAGLMVQAGKLDSSLIFKDGWEQVGFASAFSEAPAIFSSVQTFNGGDPVVTRHRDINSAGFRITMDEEEALRDWHTTETLGWVAIEKGSGTTADNRSVVVLEATANHTPQPVAFGQSFDGRFPVLLSDIATMNGPDTCFLRYHNLGPSSVELFIQEEQSLDLELNHVSENVSLFVAK